MSVLTLRVTVAMSLLALVAMPARAQQVGAGGTCSPFRRCAAGLTCEPLLNRCYHRPRQLNEPCLDGRACAEGLSCEPGTRRCVSTPPPPPPPSPGNVALGKRTSQSSTDFGGSSDRAVDGNTNGAFFDGSVTHTGNEPGAWWMVDLGAEHRIERVTVHNRSDCCAERLRATVFVTETEGWPSTSITFQQDLSEGLGVVEVPMGSSGEVHGRYVYVVQRAPDFLSLAEVEVRGAPLQPAPEGPPPPTPTPTPTPPPTPPTPTPTPSDVGPSVEVALGSCRVKVVSATTWTANPNGTFDTVGPVVKLVTSNGMELPVQGPAPMSLNPSNPQLNLTPDVLPLPKDGIFADLIGGLDTNELLSLKVDTGANIRQRMGALFVDPGTSYLFAGVTVPFVLSLDENNRSSPQRTQRFRASAVPGSTTMGLAIDPCDPAVFFGGINVQVSGANVALDGIGFSLNGRVHDRTDIQFWTGRTLGDGQPELAPRTLDGHLYAKGTLGVGLGKGLTLSGTLAATINLDPRHDGVIGLAQAMRLLSGRPVDQLPDFQALVEGSVQMDLLGLTVPFARAALAFDSPDGRRLQVSVAGERRMGGSFADLFPGVTVPGANLIEAQGTLQVFANAGFDVQSPQSSGSYQAKIRGVVRVAGAQIDGDVDITFHSGAAPEVCVKLPGLGRLCGRDIELAAKKVAQALTQAVVDSALETKRFFVTTGNELDQLANDVASDGGRALDVMAHATHSLETCEGEARALGERRGRRMHDRAAAKAMAFFDAIRPQLNGATPDERAGAVNASYRRLYGLLLEKQQKIETAGANKVVSWSAKPKSRNKLLAQYSQGFSARVGDVSAVLAEIYARPENVGRPSPPIAR